MTRPPPSVPSGKRIHLGPGAEFDLIRGFVSGDDALPEEVRIGPGDDAAVLRDGWCVSTDLSIEGVHFRREWLTDEEIGYRAGAVALSDLAAMAATPVAVLVSIAAAKDGGVDLDAVNRGLRRAAESVGAGVVGGDLSRSPGPLFIDVVALGRSGWPVQRDGAEPGDDVWVTGALGASAAAVELWERGEEPSPTLRTAFAAPVPRIEAACSLVEHEVVDALIDLSDGLAGDAGHIAAASGVRIVLEEERIPVAPGVVDALGLERARWLALYGGEDYELCFVTDPDVVDPGYFAKRYGLAVTRVGSVEEGSGVRLRTPSGEEAKLERGGFDHWSSDAPRSGSAPEPPSIQDGGDS